MAVPEGAAVVTTTLPTNGIVLNSSGDTFTETGTTTVAGMGGSAAATITFDSGVISVTSSVVGAIPSGTSLPATYSFGLGAITITAVGNGTTELGFVPSDSAYSAVSIPVTVGATEDESYLNKRGLTHFWENVDDIKQDKLTAGAGISITGNTISATGGGTADAVDWGHITGTMSNQTDLMTALNAKANTADLATVATSGSYNDLSDKPTIPGGTITGVSVNNTSIATSGVANIPLVSRNLDGAVPKTDAVGGAYDGYVFGIDADTAKWMKLSYNNLSNKPTIPTKTSDLTNDSGFLTSYTETDPIYSASPAAGITSADITAWNNKSDFSGSYNDLTNKPTIPSLTRRTSTSAPATVGSLVLGGNGTSTLPYAFPTIVGTNDESFWSYIRTTDITSGISEAYLGAYEYDPTENWWSGKKEARLALYSDIPTVGNATLTIQKNGASAGTFTANATSNKTINITVPTTAADVSALPASTKYGASIAVSINTTDYKVTTTLKDQDGNTLGTAQVIDLPLESVVVNGSYDNTNKKIVLTLQNGNTIDIPVADLVAGLQSEITSTNKLASDLVDDTNQTHKFMTSAEKTKLSGIAAGAEVNVQSDWDQTTTTADDYIKNKPSLAAVATSGSYNDLSNKPTIPTVNNAILTIQRNGTNVQTFTANQSTNATANITVPTKTSDLTNDSGFLTAIPTASSSVLGGIKVGTGLTITNGVLSTDATAPSWDDITGKPTFATVATSGSYNDLSDKPTIPSSYRFGVASGGTDTQISVPFTTLLHLRAGDNVGLSTTSGTGYRDVTINAVVPTKTSDLTNDSGFLDSVAWGDVTGKPSFATVATSGSYNDLSNKPTIPTVNNATLTIQKNGTTVKTFTANASSNVTANITVPTATSELTNDSGFLDSVAWGDVTGKPTFATVATSGSYNDLSNKPTIPAAQVQANWTQTSTTAVDYIKNKPTIPTVNNATLTITQNGTSVGTFTANASANKTIAVTDTTYDNATTSAAGLMSSADKTKLNGIATGAEVNVQSDWSVTDSSSDAFIKNKPTIPTVNNGTLTIQKNGTNVATFTANQSGNSTANITVPTKTSELTNNSGFLTSVQTSNIADGAVTTAKIKTNGTWTSGTYASGYKASTNAGYIQGIQACVFNGFLIIRFGVSKSSGNFTANSEVTIGTIPSTVDGVDVSDLVSGSSGKKNIYRANLSGASNAMGFCQLNGLNISVNPSASAGWVAGQMMIPLNW